MQRVGGSLRVLCIISIAEKFGKLCMICQTNCLLLAEWISLTKRFVSEIHKFFACQTTSVNTQLHMLQLIYDTLICMTGVH